jgi:hypothetical protein
MHRHITYLFRRMKGVFLWAVFTGCLQSAAGQNYTFESAAVPSEWLAEQGILSVSAEHYKEGSQSLQWTASGVSRLVVTVSPYTTHSSNSAFMQIYVPEANNDTLVVEFMNGIAVQRKANLLCNTRGWREFNRAYTEYASTGTATVNALRITLKPTGAAQRKIFFDDIRLNQTTASGRVPGTQWLLDRAYMTANNRPLTYYAYYVNETDLLAVTPSAQELSNLNTLRATNIENITPAYNAVQALTARNYVNNSMNIVFNADGTLSGTVINTQPAGLTADAVTTILQRLTYLAAAALNNVSDMQAVFSKYLDHVLDQGLSEGCNLIFESSDYTNPRAIVPLVLNLIPACSDAQKAEVIKLARWLAFYGAMYEPAGSYLSNINSDIMYLHGSYIQLAAMYYPDNAIAVRELKAVKRFLERYTESVPGGNDMLKPDGTGFHHNAHYNNYMYAYQPLLDCMYLFRGTEFRVSTDAYLRFRKAVLAVYTMATLSTGDSRFFANTLCGRNPFEAGIILRFSKDKLEKLITVGGDCLGTVIDEELAAAYNYFYQSTKYAVPQNIYEGFYQFNYGSLGIFRHDNWVATMHAPTAKLWGSEIYSGANRFGRYQSHGALEITYGGAAQTASGYPSGTSNGGGWDWNVIPGTTTVHYTSWQEMMPNRNTTQRFDQYAKTKNFAGALSSGDCGVFACDFDQIDTWGSQQFTPTNLVFKKSMFAFDKLIISLGSDISSSGSYGSDMITATNLFQSIVPASGGGSLILNGNTLAKPYRQVISGSGNNWLITPQGTGYYIPQGNDDFELVYDSQKTPKQDGSDYANPTTTATAAKAYIKHGVKPSSKNYCFVVAPSTTSEQMASLAGQIGGSGGDLFTVHAQSSTLHALTYKPSNTTAYAFFASMSDVPFGIVRSVTIPLLLIDKPEASTGRHYFSVCNPDLKPQSNSAYGWMSQPSTATLTLDGEWLPVAAVDGVSFSGVSNGKTQVAVSLSEGLPVYFGAKTPNETKIENVQSSPWINFSKTKNTLRLLLQETDNKDVHINIYGITGASQYHSSMPAGAGQTKEISLQYLPKGVCLCVVTNGEKTETYKFTN